MAPMQVSLRGAIGVLKDQTSISIAKVSSAGVSDLDIAIVKATSHEDAPMEEKYVQEVLLLTSYSRSYVTASVQGIAKRLGKTRDWIVAIKALMLAHRLLRDGGSALEEELTLHSRRGMRVLNASDFRDEAHLNGWEFSAFIHAYGHYLEERLHCTSIGSFVSRQKQDWRSPYNDSRYERSDSGYHNDSRNADDHNRLPQRQKNRAVKDMKPEELLENFPTFQRALDRVLACKPTGMAKVNRLVNIALCMVVRESFMLYTDIRDGLIILLDAFFDMGLGDCTRVFDTYLRATKQIEALIKFYAFCKALGICGTNEYPNVERISEDMLETMEEFLRNRSDAYHGFKGPRSFKRERLDEAEYEINGMKALPAPQPAEDPISNVPAANPSPVFLPDDRENAELLNVKEPAFSIEEHENKLAIALFSGSETKVNSKWESFQADGNESKNGAGWELALVEAGSGLSNPSGNALAGGFSNLLLDNLYEQGADRQKRLSAAAPSGSASSVAIPGRSQNNFLALPAPPSEAIAFSEDPFAASVSIPPPAYVQMSELRQKQQLMMLEQQQWIQYQQSMMQGNIGMMKFPNYPFASSFSPLAYATPNYGMNPYYH